MQLRFVGTLIVLALGTSSIVTAQTATTGQIVGAVTDPSGAVINGATVKLDSQAGLHREASTAQDGGYLFNLLPPGHYSVLVASPGFQNASVKDVEVKITETVTVNVPLQIGNAADVVNVAAEASLVQTTTPVLGRVVDERTLSELPLATRNYTQILGLSTGAATYLPDNTAVGRNSQNISVNGARVTNNNFIVNGIDANSMGTNSAPRSEFRRPNRYRNSKFKRRSMTPLTAAPAAATFRPSPRADRIACTDRSTNTSATRS